MIDIYDDRPATWGEMSLAFGGYCVLGLLLGGAIYIAPTVTGFLRAHGIV